MGEVRKKLLLAGGTGFLGTHAKLRFEADGYEVMSLSRAAGCDLRDRNALSAVMAAFKPDLVVNCAAHVGGISYNDLHPVAINEDNLRIGMNLIRASAEAKVELFVNILPNCTYPGEMDIYVEDHWWDGPIHPSVLAYGLSRKMAWGLCEAYRKEASLKSIHLILPNMYGPGDHFEDSVRSHALGALIGKILHARERNEEEVVVWGSGKPRREWLYVEDAVVGISLALKHFDRFESNGICNIGCGHALSIRELAEVIRDAVGWNGAFRQDLSKPDGAPVKMMSTSRMQERLDGWLPPTKLDEGIRKTLQWLNSEKMNESRSSTK